MPDSAVDLFKFVSLRSPSEPQSSDLVRTHVVDERLGAPARDNPPIVEDDAPNFIESVAATDVYLAVRQAVEGLSSPSEVPAANRAVAQVFAHRYLYPPDWNRGRITRFGAVLSNRGDATLGRSSRLLTPSQPRATRRATGLSTTQADPSKPTTACSYWISPRPLMRSLAHMWPSR